MERRCLYLVAYCCCYLPLIHQRTPLLLRHSIGWWRNLPPPRTSCEAKGHSLSFVCSRLTWKFVYRACFYQILPGLNAGGQLGTWEMISRRLSTDVSFHRVFETVICLNPPCTYGSLSRREKYEVLVNVRTRTGFNRKTFNFDWKRWHWCGSV